LLLIPYAPILIASVHNAGDWPRLRDLRREKSPRGCGLRVRETATMLTEISYGLISGYTATLAAFGRKEKLDKMSMTRGWYGEFY
jgi:hypothetical protein